MVSQKLPLERTSQSPWFFRPQAVCSVAMGLILLGYLLIGSPRVGVSQQPSRASVTSPLVSTQSVSSRPSLTANPAALKDKIAQSPDKRPGSDSKPAGRLKRSVGSSKQAHPFKPRVPVSAEDETAVHSFLQEHHAELASVLDSLKKKHPQAYDRALADLNRTRERLELLKSRDEVRYERELEIWKTKSRIQLLVVRIKMKPEDTALQTEFRELIGKQLQQHREQLVAEQQRLEQRLEKVQEQIGTLSENPDKQIEQQMQRWLASGDFALRNQAKQGKNPKSPQVKIKTKKAGTVPVRTDTKDKARP